jgi:hypothetical protein
MSAGVVVKLPPHYPETIPDVSIQSQTEEGAHDDDDDDDDGDDHTNTSNTKSNANGRLAGTGVRSNTGKNRDGSNASSAGSGAHGDDNNHNDDDGPVAVQRSSSMKALINKQRLRCDEEMIQALTKAVLAKAIRYASFLDPFHSFKY